MTDKYNDYKNELIQDLYDFHIQADIPIEELADSIMDRIQNMSGRAYVDIFGTCPVCTDCPDNCPLDNK